MVARINTSKSIQKALNYNEQKVQQGKAASLDASGFVKDLDRMNFYDKMQHFERLITLNERASTNTLHVSLNFDPSEQLSNEKMQQIAERYMEKIGFGKQPYLVYRHYDAGHPHLHIVSTNIQRDGSRISMHNLGRNQSEKARKEIEQEFGLVKAESKKLTDALKLQPVNARKVVYGKSETKRAIANVLMTVINQYKFSSLAELNAVLQLYNIRAERGEDQSRMYQQNGLTYRVLDEQGNKIGTPIKASAFYMKPTLSFLGKKFIENENDRQPLQKRLKTIIDWTLNKQSFNLPEFIKALEKENISTVLRQNKEGMIYGITYVDHKTKAVFNGSDLGKAYSAKAIQERCGSDHMSQQKTFDDIEKRQAAVQFVEQHTEGSRQLETVQVHLPKNDLGKTIDALITPVHTIDYLPNQLKKYGKKKKKKKSLV